MKKIKYLLIPLILILTGCFNNKSMEDITIYTTNYPIEYVTSQLYKDHSTIKTIYPNGVDLNNYRLTKTLINKYDDNDMYIFNSLTNEKDYVKQMIKNNSKLMIIDVTSDIKYDYSVEELWLDPSNLLNLANNIKKGFIEYIKNNPVLIDEINSNYNELKMALTDLESKYREELSYKENKTIIVSNDMFMFLEKYGLKVISLDKDNENYNDNLMEARSLLYNGQINKLFIPDNEQLDNDIQKLGFETVKLNTVSVLTEEQRESSDYISLIEENLEIIKNN